MSTHVIDESGRRYDRLLVGSRVDAPGAHAMWSCACDCGRAVVIAGGNLRNGHSRSCGCLARELMRRRAPTIGLATRFAATGAKRVRTPAAKRRNEVRPCLSDPTAVEICMPGGLVAVVDLGDALALREIFWRPNKRRNTTYARATVNGATVSLHRFLWSLRARPSTRFIDHEDRDGLNCRSRNLRAATPMQNACNRKSTQSESVKTSRFKGVSRKRGKNWTALIGVNGKYIHLGTFAKEEDAAAAYREAAIKYHGEFARTEW